MKTLMIAGLMTAMAGVAAAEVVQKPSPLSVTDTMDRLEAQVTDAGATVFARVNHTEGAMKVDMTLRDEELLIFGNPRLGTPAMQDDPLAGLALPLRVLVYDGGDGTIVAYETVGTLFDGLAIPADAAYRDQIAGALDKLTDAATSD